jgi:hypothetical protein
MSLGLIVVGDFALATGEDRHVKFVATLLGKTAHSLSWAWLIPASRVAIASALFEAFQRPHPVACFGGLGTGVDDPVYATLAALQQGLEQVGKPRHLEERSACCTQVGNVVFFRGHPEQSHANFSQWWAQALALTASQAEPADAAESVRWQVPETPLSRDARRLVKTHYPQVQQRLLSANDGNVALSLRGASKGKVQAARKALQAALKKT